MARFNRRSTAEQVTEGLDLTGQNILITGVNTGLGLESMRVLTMRGAHVIGLARTQEKAEKACASVAGETTPLACELSDFDSVAACADQVNGLGVSLDVLMCNAGIMALPERQLAHGMEMQFATNHMGHYLLVRKLLDAVVAAEAGRIVMLSSMGHMQTVTGGIDFDDLAMENDYSPWKAYGQSKLANLLCAKALDKQLKGTAAIANAVHPGVIKTDLGRHTGDDVLSRLITAFAGLLQRDVAQGAATQCYMAVHPDVAAESGNYYADCKIKRPSAYGRDEALAERLWEESEIRVAAWL